MATLTDTTAATTAALNARSLKLNGQDVFAVETTEVVPTPTTITVEALIERIRLVAEDMDICQEHHTERHVTPLVERMQVVAKTTTTVSEFYETVNGDVNATLDRITNDGYQNQWGNNAANALHLNRRLTQRLLDGLFRYTF